MDYIFIDCKDRENRVGIVEEGNLVEYYIEEEDRHKIVGNIYRGRVDSVLKGMNASFVNIGEGKNAYLHVKDAINREQMLSRKKFTIDEVLRAGEDIIVQVLKEPLGEKGPKVTTHVSIPGRYLVLTPFSDDINISRKINDKEETERLKTIGKDMLRDNIGAIFRTMARGIDRETIVGEYNALVDIYKKIESQKNFLPTPKLLYRELDLVYRIVRDIFNEKRHKIIVNNRYIYEELLQLDEYFFHGLKDKLILDEKFSIEYNSNIQRGISEAFKRRVNLKSGGYIVIDDTEALTAIDINTGKYVGSYSFDETVVNTNIEATEEIARQIRLRDIGGIIIIDFIDMKNKEDISMVIKKLSKHFKADRNKPNIIGITKLGLVEVTRKKIRPTIDSRISVKCPTCNGRGRIPK